MKPYKRPESVLVIIYDEKSRVLMLQREDDPDFWQSVTGSMEEGESPIETAYREVFEEIGVSIPQDSGQIIDCHRINQYVIRKKWQHRYPPDTKYNTEHVFKVCIDSSSEITLSEHLQYEWLPKSEAMEKAWSMSNAKGIRDMVPTQ